MSKKFVSLCIAWGLCLATVAQAANIIWVSDNKNGTSTPSDKGFVDLLKAQGYNVDYQGQGGTGAPGYQFWRTLDNAKIATLNAADLIILSRDLNSGDYASNATEVTQWNGIKKPLLMLIAHVARNDRWQWVETTGQNDVQPALQAVKTDHPIFNGVTLDANKRVNVFSGVGSISSATSAGNGTLIATRADNNQVWIAEWQTGQIFKSTSTQTAGGPRLLFAAGATGAGGPDGTLNLTPEGQRMFLNAVRYLLGDAPVGLADKPQPADKATDVPADVTLSWTAGKFAASHDVYLGLSATDVNNATRATPLGVLASQGQSAGSYTPAGLAFGQTYYWRIDEVNAPPSNTVIKGGLWSFTVEPFAYPLQNVTATASSAQDGMGPEKTVNGSGLNAADQHSTEAKDMWLSMGVQPNWIQYQFDKAYKLHELWVWNSNQLIEPFVGFGAKKVTVETSADGKTWTPVANVPDFAQANGLATYTANTTVNLGGAVAKYVKLTINTNWGGAAPQTGLAEVKFFYVPVEARVPQPATAAKNVAVDVTLDWRAGRDAASHEVYFGTDPNAVANGTAAAKTVTKHGYVPDSLSLGTTYYWRVDEVNTVTYPGSVWSFTTQDYKVVDDFESYTDKAGAEIFSAWIDGFENPAKNGAVVGLATAVNGTFGETTIIHGGGQAMPLAYDNTKAPTSEAVLTFSTPQNWTANGIKSLSLWFQGVAGNTGQLYLKINSTRVSYSGPAGDLAKSMWTPWNIDLSTTGANLSKVTSLTIGIEGAGAKGMLYLDDIRLYPKAPAYTTPADPGKANLVGYWTLDGNANDTSGKGNNGTVTAGTAQWVPGQVGQALQFNGGPMYVDCGKGAGLNLTDAVTVVAWMKMDFTAGDRKIAANQDGVAGGYKLGLYSNNKVEFEVRTGATSTLNRNSTGGTVLQQGVWYHVAGVYSKGQFIRTYVFGNLDREMLTTGVLGPTAGSFKIGCGESATTYFWLGALDDVQVYNKALSQEELLWLAGQKTPVAKPF